MQKTPKRNRADRVLSDSNDTPSKNIISKTKIKKATREITNFGCKLIAMNNEQIRKLPLAHNVINALLDAKSMRRAALKRQTQYIGKLLRNSDIEKIEVIYKNLAQVRGKNGE